MFYFIQNAEYEPNPIMGKMLWFSVIAFFVFILWRIILFLESFWVEYIKRQPPFRHIYLWKRKLKKNQLQILKTDFSFYNKLSKKEQVFFEHRVATFIESHIFEDKSDGTTEDEKKVLVAATAIMLTFGYRSCNIEAVERFIIYPETYYSKINKTYHKGEFNPNYRAIVLSWKDFLHGYDISNDNFNLGIHEYVHAMHFEYMKPSNTSVSAIIFINTYNELRQFLDNDDAYKQRLVSSRYLRDYAYTNQFEFVAVLIESFMETPQEFKAQFPEMYAYVKQMLNFNFAGY